MAQKKRQEKKLQKLTEKIDFEKPSRSSSHKQDTSGRINQPYSPGHGKKFEPNRDRYRRYD